MHNLPNLISLLRLLMVPVTVWLIISEAFGWAFAVFLVAGLSDGVDGALARRFDWRSTLGTYLDAVADKALLVSIFVTLGFQQLIPAWLVLIVVSRDVLIIGAVLLSRLMDNPVRVAPLLVSKVNTVGQILFAVALLGAAALSLPLSGISLFGGIPVALLTLISGGAYLTAWLRHMAEHSRQEHEP